MDTSEKYILMCEKAQKDINKREELWDWYYDKESETIEVVVGLNTDHPMGNNFHKDEIPLYRQDQLQEMFASCEGTMESSMQQLRGFIYRLDLNRHYYKEFYKSFEQLWLAFVMHEKYKKQWDDEKGEWVID